MKSNYGTNEIETNNAALLAHRERMLLPLSALGSISFAPFFIYNFAAGNYFLGAAILALTLVFFLNFYALHRHRKPPIPFEILLFPAAIAIGLSITRQGVYGTYWCYPLLLYFYFVLSRRTANLCGIALLIVVTIIVFQYIGLEVMVRFAVSLSLLIVMANIIVGAIDSLHRQLLEQTIKDPLTGAFNRRYMELRLNDAIVFKKRKANSTSILMIDIDHFKSVNDGLGHAAGDKVLKEIVRIINEHTRQFDKFFRIGGEEFLLFLTETDEKKAMIVAEHTRRLIAESTMLEDRNVTVSIGVSELRSGETLDEWIKSADDALYRAKAEGRNRVVSRNSVEADKEDKNLAGASL